MKITVITGSAHKNGTSSTLAEQFIAGAKEAGNEVTRFDAAFHQVKPCLGCEHCHTTEDGCVHKDDMEALNELLLQSDMIVFASPIYYYAMSAQIKTVIDRFYAGDAAIHGGKRTALLLTMADTSEKTAQGAVTSFQLMAEYLGWEICGVLLGLGCGSTEDMQATEYPKKAYELGLSMKEVRA